MRVAVTYEDGMIFQHYGRAEKFKIFDVQDGKIIDSKVVDTMGKGHGALVGVLKALEVDVLICGGIGLGAQIALQDAGIDLYGGRFGDADKVVQEYAEGKLVYNVNVECNHQHGEGHVCGNHGCIGR